jgi:hypothetical protein
MIFIFDFIDRSIDLADLSAVAVSLKAGWADNAGSAPGCLSAF